MLRRLALAAVSAIWATACYAPTANPGAPCGPGGECPTGQECRASVCFAIGTPDDASAAIDTSTDTAQVTIDAPTDAPAYVAWGTPVELTSLNTVGGKSDPSITANTLTLALVGATTAGDDDLYLATRTALTDTFTVSALTTLSSTTTRDKSPEISPDGLTLWFASDRATAGNFEIYVSTFSTTWSPPVLRTDLSSTASDSDLAVSPDQLTAAVVRAGPPNHIYVYTRATTSVIFSSATLHAELEVTTDIASPTITNGGATIYFHAGSPTRDLYVSHRQMNGTYTTPAPVTELNTVSVRDAAPFVLQTDDYMLFERNGKILQSIR